MRNERVHIIHQKNNGLSCSRNTGILLSRGKYICFIDSDDSVAPNYCDALYHLLDGTNYDFSVCGVMRYRDGDTMVEDQVHAEDNIVSNKEYFKKQLTHQFEFGVLE